jgi:cytochrome c peroxidase
MRSRLPTLLLLVAQGCSGPAAARAVITKAQLGSTIFSDPALSEPAGQACADCHSPRTAFRDPEADHSTSGGAVAGRFGPRNSPTAMYSGYIPDLRLDPTSGTWIGGLFWDGRADTLENQAALPLLNPLEMNNADKASVVEKVRRSKYARAFVNVYGPSALDQVDEGFSHVTEALAEFERTTTLAPFSSRYDRYLAGAMSLTDQELRGLAIFEDPARGNCAGCHPSRPSADGTPPLFTNFTYANLGIPKYRNSMFYEQPAALNRDGDRYVDHGLMTTVGDPQQDGKFRVPTLRNVGRTAPYGHNGYFGSLPYFIDFLNTRDVGSHDVGTCSRTVGTATCSWPMPEVPATVEPTSVGHLRLSANDVDDLVAFLLTLSDE